MDTIGNKLRLLVETYRARGLPHGDGMLPPADPLAIDLAEKSLGCQFPPSLRLAYATFGGQDYLSPGVTGIFGRHRLLSPTEAAKDHQMYEETVWPSGIEPPPPGCLPGENWNYWHPALIPFASWDAYNLVMCHHTHRIWEYEPYSGLSTRLFPNLDALLGAALLIAEQSDEPALDFYTE